MWEYFVVNSNKYLIVQEFAKYVYKQNPVCDNFIKWAWSDILKNYWRLFLQKM